MIHPKFARPFCRKGGEMEHFVTSFGNVKLTRIRNCDWQEPQKADDAVLRIAPVISTAHGGRTTQTIIPIASQSIQYSGLILALRPFRVIAVDCQPRERVKKLAWLAPASQKRTRRDRILTDLLRPIRSGAFDDLPATNY